MEPSPVDAVDIKCQWVETRGPRALEKCGRTRQRGFLYCIFHAMKAYPGGEMPAGGPA